MGKQNYQPNRKQPNKRRKKVATAVTFDQNERSQYLKNMFGAKRRRQQFHKKRVQEEVKADRKQQRSKIRQERKQRLQKTRQLLQSIKQKSEKHKVEKNYVKKEPEIKIKREGNLLIQTQFY